MVNCTLIDVNGKDRAGKCTLATPFRSGSSRNRSVACAAHTRETGGTRAIEELIEYPFSADSSR